MQAIEAKEERLAETQKSLSKLEACYIECKMMLKDTLNVKLHYERIIQDKIENEKQGGRLTMKQVIRSVKEHPKKVIIKSNN